jgi:WD40 repeat protein
VQVFKTYADFCYFFPDSRRLVTTNDYKQARVWDIATGKLLNNLGVDAESIKLVAISADGHLLALGSANNRVAVWDTHTWQQIRALKDVFPDKVWQGVFPDKQRSLEFTKDAKILIASSEKVVRFWNLQTGKRIHIEPNPLPDNPRSVLSPNKTLLALRGRTGYVQVQNLQTGARSILKIGPKGYQVRSYPWGRPYWRPNRVSYVEFSKDSTLLVAGCASQIVKIWRIPGCQEVASFTGETLALAPDAKTLAIGDEDGIITLWDTKTGKQKVVFQSSENASSPHIPSPLLFSPNGDYLVAGTDDGVKLWKWSQ